MGQAKGKILWKAFSVSLYRLIQGFDSHTINPRQIRIQNHAFAANLMYERRDLLKS